MKQLFTKTLMLLAILLLGNATLSGQTVAEQPPGDGTAANPWDVSTLAHLRWISESSTIRTDTIVISADIDAAETRYWNDGEGFTPIDKANEDFVGIIDGQNHVIRNLYINLPGDTYVGFVARVKDVGGIIKNLGIENCDITGDQRTGAIAGDLDGVIENCYSTGTIISSDYPGGIAGYLNGNGTILRCYSQVDITVLNRRAGGMCSENGLDSLAFSYSSGSISGSTTDVGGFVGRAADETSPSRTRDNYWDMDRSGYTTSSPDEALVFATGLTSAEMKTQASFVNWDFTNNWGIAEGKTSPFLKWQQIVLQNDFPVEGTNKTSLGAGYVFNNASDGVTITEYGYIYGIDSLPWYENDAFSHGTKLSEVTGVSIASGSGADISGAELPKVEKGKILYAVTYAIASDGTVAFGNKVTVAPPLLSDGSGTVEDPWQISTLDQLNAVNVDLELLDDYFILMNDIDAALTKDWNGGDGWTPIDGFSGTFDGDGYVIKNLYINLPDNSYTGFFGRMDQDGAIVKNLGIVDADVTGDNRTGILVGRIEDGSQAINCYTSGIVKGTQEVGGLAGRVNGDGYVYNCYTTAMAYGSDDSNTRVGGFTGANFVGGSVEAIIQDCYSTGAAFGGERIGGFIGNYLTGEIFNSYSTGGALGDDMVGGFVGRHQADSASKIQTGYWDITLVSLPGVGLSTEDLDDHIPEYFVLDVTGLSTTEMKAEASFAGWDFTDAWNIKEGVSRPYLDITDVMIINDAPAVTNQKVDITATVHNIAAADITEAGFIFRTPDLSWSDKVVDASFTGPVAIDGSGTITVSYDDVLAAGNYYSVQSYATDADGMNYYGDASFVYIEQEVYDASVVVNDELGAVVAGATVTLDGYGSQTTDAAGTVSFTDVVAGEKIPLTVENAGYNDLVTSLMISSDETVTYGLSLNNLIVEFTVTDTAGAVLQGANVALLGGSSLTTDASGVATFGSVMEASGILYEVSLADYVTLSGELNLTADVGLTVELEPRSVMIEVVDNDGVPVPGASVTAGALGTIVSDDAGLAVFTPVAPATDVSLEIVADSFNIYTTMFDIGNETVHYTAALVPTMVRFVITDENDMWFEGVEVILGEDTVSTGGSGSADFFRVPSGVDVAYTADDFGYAPQTGSVNLSNENDTIFLSMTRNLFNMTFVVTDLEDVALAGAEVLITGVDTMTTDAEGMAMFESLPIGDHPYVVTNGLAYAEYTGTLSVVDMDDTETVKMTPLLYTVTITVEDTDGNAVEGANVTLSGYGILSTDETGTVVYADVVPANNIIYSVNKSGYEDAIDVLNVVDADVSLTVAVTAVAYDVTLAVEDVDSNPIDGATVSVAGMDDQTTDASGNAALTGLTGDVEYTVTKDGYETVTGNLTFADKDQTISVTLTPVDGIFGANASLYAVFPNPATDYLSIELLERGSQLKVYDMTGKVTVNRNISSDHVRLDLSDQNTGIYILKVWDNEGQLMGSAKFVIQK